MDAVLDYNTEIYFRVQKDRIMNVIKKRPKCRYCTYDETLQKLCQITLVMKTNTNYTRDTFFFTSCLKPLHMMLIIDIYLEQIVNRYEYSNKQKVFEAIIFYLRVMCYNAKRYDVHNIGIIIDYQIHINDDGSSTIHLYNCKFQFTPYIFSLYR